MKPIDEMSDSEIDQDIENLRKYLDRLHKILDKPSKSNPETKSRKLGCVYILSKGNSQYKIGYSFKPDERIEYLGVTLPFPVEPEHRIATDDPQWLEKQLHSIFSNQRLKGEWFRLSNEDIESIKSITEVYSL